MPNFYTKIKITKGENIGHSGGHNQLINQMTGQYYICASNDMYYEANMVETIVELMEDKLYQNCGSATIKIKYWGFNLLTESKNNLLKSKTNIIDSYGLLINQYHHFSDRGQGENDNHQYDKLDYIFGASGALAVYRQSALNAIPYVNSKNKVEYFDEFLHYKNDIDLAYRLQWAGHKCLFIPSAVAYHHRQVSAKSKLPFKNRVYKSKTIKADSYWGQMVLMYKNYDDNFPWLIKIKFWLYKFLRLIYIVVKEPEVLKQYTLFKQKLPYLKLKKVSVIKKVSPIAILQLMK